MKSSLNMNSTAASVKNIHKQKQLELELVEIERLWYLQLKNIARERLRVIRDLQKIAEMKSKLTYFATALKGPSLRQYIDQEFQVMHEEKEIRKKLRKYDFTVDPLEKVSLHLPAVTVAKRKESDSSEDEKNDSVNLVTLEDVLGGRKAKGSLGNLDKNRLRIQKTKRRKRRRRRSGITGIDDDDGRNGEMSSESSNFSRVMGYSSSESMLYGNVRKRPNLAKVDFTKKKGTESLPAINESRLYVKLSHKSSV